MGEGVLKMRVQVVNIDKLTRKYCKVYHWKIYEVLRIRIVELPPRNAPHFRKEYIVKNNNSVTGTLTLHWYEVKELK